MKLSKSLKHLCLGTLFFQSILAAADEPNIIMIMSDDQGWGDVGFNGNSDLKTPHLDAMAANGTKFNRFYAASPLCSPTRGSCLTGRNPFRFGILAAHTAGMRQGEITVSEMLQSKKYKTGHFGKWHIGWVKLEDAGSRGHYTPPSEHGYDTFLQQPVPSRLGIPRLPQMTGIVGVINQEKRGKAARLTFKTAPPSPKT